MKRIAFTGAVLLSSLLSFTVTAAELSPEEQAAQSVATRQAVFKLLSFANGSLRPGASYDVEAAKVSAERIAVLGAMIPDLFAANTSAAGVQSRSADTIWTAKADFDQLAHDLVAGANEALNILNTKGADGAREAVAAIGPKCGACHDRFRLD